MTDYPKVIEHPYKVYYGVREFIQGLGFDIEWTYDKSFNRESDAASYANRIAEEYEFVKIEKKRAE